MGQIIIDEPYPKQIDFFLATARYIGYGGARGGGKSWAARAKAILLDLNYPGIQVLLLRRQFTELRENHILPLKKLLKDIAVYKSDSKEFGFPNGSRIVLGYCAAESDVLQYQGQSYDVIFMEEATQFTEFQFQSLTECNRSSGMCSVKFSPRMYFTCNPGGVGHNWVKRLFIDKIYRNSERPEDYVFIKSLVYENKYLMENSPDYIRTLENLPEKRRKAMLYGDWDIFDGQYFTEFNRDIHVIKAFEIPDEWKHYVVIDYGLDMLACYEAAIDTRGKIYVIKELYKPGLIVSTAAEKILELVGDDKIYDWLCPPDLKSRQKDTGKSIMDLFYENGINFSVSDNNRVAGWQNLHEWLKPYTDEQEQITASLVIFENCLNLIRCLPELQYDTKNPDDCATQPHEITHAPDALRYLVAGRPTPTKIKKPEKSDWEKQKEKQFRKMKRRYV